MTKRQSNIAISCALTILVILCILSLVFCRADNSYQKNTINNIEELATANTPITDGNVANQYTDYNTVSQMGYTAIGGTSGKNFSYVRSWPSNYHMLMGDITIDNSIGLDTTTKFTGVLDGNGHTIYIDADLMNANVARAAGLFAELAGTVKNVKIVVTKFSVGTTNNYTTAGILSAVATAGAIVENVSITLNYSPENNTTAGCDFYLYQATQTDVDSTIRLGGLIGAINGDTTINKVTVDNKTTGNYGFSMLGWRKKDGNAWIGVHSDGFHHMGAFVASVDGGNFKASNITLAGNYNSKYYIANESTADHRYNLHFFGGIVGYQNEGSSVINGLIVSHSIRVDAKASGESVDYQNVKIVNGNYDYKGRKSVAGILLGHIDGGTTFTAKNLYFKNGNTVGFDKAQDTWLNGKDNNISGVTHYNTAQAPVFDGQGNISYYGLKRVAPDSTELVAEIEHTGVVVNVLSQAMLGEGESEGLGWVKVPVVEHTTDGVNHTINLSKSKAVRSSLGIQAPWTLSDNNDNTAYTASRLYNGANAESPSITLGSATISNAYIEQGEVNAYVGEHTLVFDESKLGEYKLTRYNSKTYVYHEAQKTVYLPSALGQGTCNLDKPIKLEIQRLPIEIGFYSTGIIEYGDTLEAVKSKNNDVRVLSVNGVLGASIPDSIASWDIEGYVEGEVNAGEIEYLKVSNVVMVNNATDNYIITYPQKAFTVAKKHINLSAINALTTVAYNGGVFSTSFLDGLFKATDDGGREYEVGFEYTITLNGHDATLQNAGEYTVSATLDKNSNFYADQASTTVKITPYQGEIGIADKEVQKTYDAEALTIQDLLDMFIAPKAEFDNHAVLEILINGELAGDTNQVLDAGEYTITAQISSQDVQNYSAEAKSLTYTVNPKSIDMIIESDESKIFDGTPDYDFASVNETLEALFYSRDNVDVNVEALSVSANVGKYLLNITTSLDGAEKSNYIIASRSEDKYLIIEPKQVSITANESATKSKIYNGDAFTSFSSLFNIPTDIDGQKLKYDYAVTKDSEGVESVLNAGEYSIVATLSEGQDNYTSDTATATYTISKKNVSISVNQALVEKVYTGEIFADFEEYFTAPEGVKEEGTLSLTFSEASGKTVQNADTYTICANLDAKYTNYTAQEQTIEFVINKAQPVLNIIVEGDLYDGHEMPPISLGEGSTQGTIVWEEGQVLDAEVSKYKYIYTPSAENLQNYNSVSGEYELYVKEIALDKLEVVFDTKGEVIYTNAELNSLRKYLSIRGINNDGSDAGVIDSQLVVLEVVGDKLVEGKNTIKVLYNGVEASFELEAKAVYLDRIEIDNMPNKTQYITLEEVDLTGIKVTAYYTNGDTKNVSESVVSNITNVAIDTKVITISYTDGDYTRSAEIPVEVSPIEITKPVYTEGKTFDYDGTLHNYEIADGEGYSISGDTSAQNAGTYNIVITLDDKVNCVWADDNTNNDINIVWTINQAVVGGKIILPDMQYDNTQKTAEFDIQVGQLYGENESIIIEYEGDRVNVGELTITASLPSDNYKWAEGVQNTISTQITAIELELQLGDLTAVKGEEFELDSINAQIVGTSDNKITIGDSQYDYTIVLSYTNEVYDSATAEIGDKFALTVTVDIIGIDAGNYQYDNTAELTVIGIPLTGNLVADRASGEYDGNGYGATLDNPELQEGVDFKVQYSLKGSDVWSDTEPVEAGRYLAMVVALKEGYSGERIPQIEFEILPKTVIIGINNDLAPEGNITKPYAGKISLDELMTYFVAPQDISGGSLNIVLEVKGDGIEVDGVGTYTITASLEDYANYTADEVVLTYTVVQAEPTVNVEVEQKEYFDGHKMPNISLGEDSTPGVIVWQQTNLELGVDTYTWEFIPTDSKNYTTLTGEYHIDVIAVELAGVEITIDPEAKIFISSTADDIKEYLIIVGTNNDGSKVYDLPKENVELQISELVLGQQEVMVRYIVDDSKSFECKLIINVKEPELSYLVVEYDEQRLLEDGIIIYDNTNIDIFKDYLVVNGYKDDDSFDRIIDKSEYLLRGALKVGKSTIEVVFGEIVGTFEVNVLQKVLERIEIKKVPDRTNYTAYDTIDTTGMKVVAYYSNGTNAEVQSYEVLGGDRLLVEHSQGIVVSYTFDGKTAQAQLKGLNIAPFKVPFVNPEIRQIIYNGEEQSYIIGQESEYYTISDNTFINVGGYYAIVTLNDKDNCIWADNGNKQDGTTEDLSFYWRIDKKKVVITSGGNLSKTYDGKLISVEELLKNFSVDDPNAVITINTTDFGEGIINAGNYTITAMLDPSQTNYSTESVSYTYTINKVIRTLDKDGDVTFDVGYSDIKINLRYGIQDAEYSFDNKVWKELTSEYIDTELQAKYTVYLRYKDSQNYSSCPYKKFELNISKSALYEFIQDNFGEEFTKYDITTFERLEYYAKNAYGEHAEFDKEYARLKAQYDIVAGDLKSALSSALFTGAKVAGYNNGVATVSFATIGTGLLAVGLMVANRKKDKGRNKKLIIAIMLVAVIALTMTAFVGCKEKANEDNVGTALENIKSLTNLKVSVNENGTTIYGYDNGNITANIYNIQLNVNSLVGTKGTNNISITKDNLSDGYTFIYDSATGEATLNGKLKNTGVATLDGADIEIKTNIKFGTTSQYKVTYKDAWGYDIVIELS